MSLAKHPYRGWRKRWCMSPTSLTITHDTGLVVRVRGNLVEVDPKTLVDAQAAIAANEGTDEHVPARIKAYIKQAHELMTRSRRAHDIEKEVYLIYDQATTKLLDTP